MVTNLEIAPIRNNTATNTTSINDAVSVPSEYNKINI